MRVNVDFQLATWTALVVALSVAVAVTSSAEQPKADTQTPGIAALIGETPRRVSPPARKVENWVSQQTPSTSASRGSAAVGRLPAVSDSLAAKLAVAPPAEPKPNPSVEREQPSADTEIITGPPVVLPKAALQQPEDDVDLLSREADAAIRLSRPQRLEPPVRRTAATIERYADLARGPIDLAPTAASRVATVVAVGYEEPQAESPMAPAIVSLEPELDEFNRIAVSGITVAPTAMAGTLKRVRDDVAKPALTATPRAVPAPKPIAQPTAPLPTPAGARMSIIVQDTPDPTLRVRGIR